MANDIFNVIDIGEIISFYVLSNLIDFVFFLLFA